MKGSGVEDSPKRSRVLNAVPLQNAVLCAECDVFSDSPHDTCLVCGSHSLLNIARMFGCNLPKGRASLITQEACSVLAGRTGVSGRSLARSVVRPRDHFLQGSVADGNVYILRQRTRRLRHRGIWLRFAGQTTNADTLMFQQVKSGPRGCRGYLRRELQICRP